MSNLEKKLEDLGLDLSLIKNITTDLEGALENEICFYRIRDKKAEAVFEQRFIKSSGFVITNKKVVDSKRVLEVRESDFFKLQYQLANKIYPGIKEKKIVALTGTNGKTSVVNFCSQILNFERINTLSIGTLGILKNNKLIKKVNSTTPSYANVLRWVYEFGQDCDFVLIEVSSHALKQNRLGPLEFDVAGWTNFSQDHLDYHKTMVDYFDSKLMIIEKTKLKKIIVPETQKKLIEKIEKSKKKVSVAKMSFENEALPLAFQLSFNKENITLAKSIVGDLLKKSININYSKLTLPAGRFETFKYKNSYLVVDYAHTPDALESILRETKKAFSDFLVSVVFGCGGDRDKAKRVQMGKVATQYADRIILTSDNPRSENPLSIISDIKKGIDIEVETIEDRKKAISYAVKTIKKKEIIIVAGKGHEDTQEIDGEFFLMNDAETIKENIKAMS